MIHADEDEEAISRSYRSVVNFPARIAIFIEEVERLTGKPRQWLGILL